MARPRVTLKGGRQVLLSWSGTMFEYLMPLLFMRSYENSLLDYGCRQALREQIQYGKANGVPWGISECAYSALDANRIYQYYAFGVPSLAFNQAHENDLVVSSYSTMLALSMDPNAAVANLRELQELGMSGPMGFYESLDFSREANAAGTRGVVIYTHMAHHEGMSLLALDNILHSGVMQQRFHSDVRVRAVESLLFEQIPITKPPTEEAEKRSPRRLEVRDEFAGRTWVGETLKPRIQLCGNGRYSLMLTNAGGGYSRWNEFDITRWRSGAVGSPMGSYIYVRESSAGNVWSVTQEPLRQADAENFVYFSADHAEFRKVADDIDTVMKIAVAPDEDLELRQLTVTNRSLRRRNIELTSYMELALATHGSDVSHPAFAKMFVQTERWDRHVLAATRRPRSPEDPPIWAAHVLVGATGKISCETDRAKFLGRGHTARNPDASANSLSDSVGTVLDPIFSFRCSVVLEPRQRKTFTFLTMAASSREALASIIEKYEQPSSAAQMFELAWIRSQLQFRYLTLGPSGAHRFQELARHLIFPSPWLRVSSARLVASKEGRSALWKHGISGDLPIISVTLSESSQLRLLREVLVAHTYWRLLGLRADLVVLSEEGASYDRPLYNSASRLIAGHSEVTGTNHPGGVFLRDENLISPDDLSAILAASSVVLRGARGSLQNQLVERGEPIEPADMAVTRTQEEPSAPLPFLELAYFNGTGGFSADGREYAIYLKPGANTPAPWVNVLANDRFGTVLSESGLGFTWNQNSQSNRLTPWHNDPVSDPQSEAIYIRDEETGAVWTPTPLPVRENDAYRARHGQGYSVFEHNSHAIEQILTVFVPLGDRSDPVKICRLRLRNASSRIRRLTVTYFADWVLGTNREEQQLHVRTAYDEVSGALAASQYWTGTRAGHVAFRRDATARFVLFWRSAPVFGTSGEFRKARGARAETSG
jgi:cyclic beta-1,2-glucan synthetase